MLAAARLPRRPRRERRTARPWRVLEPDRSAGSCWTRVCSSSPCVAAPWPVGVPLAWLVVRTDLPGRPRLGDRGGAPARHPELRGRARAARRPRPARAAPAAARAARRRAGARDLRPAGRRARAHALDLPVRLPARRRRRCARSTRRSRRRRGRSGAARSAAFRRRDAARPAARRSRAGALLVALYTLSDFGAVSLMQYASLTRAIYLQYRSLFDRDAGRDARARPRRPLRRWCSSLERPRARRGPLPPLRHRARPAGRARFASARWRWPALGLLLRSSSRSSSSSRSPCSCTGCGGGALDRPVRRSLAARRATRLVGGRSRRRGRCRRGAAGGDPRRSATRRAGRRLLERACFAANALPGNRDRALARLLRRPLRPALPDAHAARVRLRRALPPAGARRGRSRALDASTRASRRRRGRSGRPRPATLPGDRAAPRARGCSPAPRSSSSAR